MKTTIESAIKILVAKSTDTKSQDEALKFTQAALNLAHVQVTLETAKRLEKGAAT